jgi:MYND finger
LLHALRHKQSDDDKDVLHVVQKNKQLPRLYRASAAETIGVSHYFNGQRMDAADWYRNAIEHGNKAKPLEQKKSVYGDPIDPTTGRTTMINTGDPSQQVLRRIGSFLDEIKYRMEHCLIDLGGGGSSTSDIRNSVALTKEEIADELQSRKGVSPDHYNGVIAIGTERPCSVTLEELTRLVMVGGSTCDHCNKTKEELGLKSKLKVCSVCKLAFYCSVDCQKKQWKEHKVYCRKPTNDFRAGDFVKIKKGSYTNGGATVGSIGSTPTDLHLEVYKIRGPDPNTEGRYIISPPGCEMKVPIGGDQLEHVRPRLTSISR